MTTNTHTPGPWRWEFNREHRSVHLVGGQPRQFDLTVMDFTRWGMGGAVPRFRDPAHDGMQLMHRLCDRSDWLSPQPGRAHHASWHLLVTHPDARLMQSAPVLLAELVALRGRFRAALVSSGTDPQFADAACAAADAAIAQATGAGT